MRIDGYHPLVPFFVWDAERCCTPKMVAWIDDALAQYGQWDDPPRLDSADEPITRIVQARRIDIHLDRRLIIINPIEDAHDVTVGSVEAVAA